MEQNHPDPAKKWKNMRIMAYIGIAMMVAVTIAAMDKNMEPEVIWPLAAFWGSVIGSYMGFSTAGDNWGRK